MKPYSIICILAMAGLLNASLAWADSAQGSGQFGAGPAQDLDTIKQRIEQRIQDRINKMQSVLACVQGAQDRQALRQCLPRRGEHRRGQFGQEHQAGPSPGRQ